MISQLAVYLGFSLMGILLSTLAISSVFSIIDYRKKRILKSTPFLSFIIPTYKDGNYIKDTIHSIYESYNSKRMEIIVVNDNSPDNTEKILSTLKKKYSLLIINHRKNTGKAVAVNEAFRKAKGEIVIVVDSDVRVTKEALSDALARMEENPRMGAVSCRYKVVNRGSFLTEMQNLEYNMLGFIQGAYNLFSAVALWGGFMVFRSEAFRDINGLSTHCLTEDMDAALKLNERGWKVSQSYIPVRTQVPNSLRGIYRQKLRWAGGFMQGLLEHLKVHLKNPLAILFVASYALFSLSFFIGLINYAYFAVSFYPAITTEGFIATHFTLISSFLVFVKAQLLGLGVFFASTVPYAVFDKEDRKKVSSYLLLVPYAFLYFPFYSVINSIGFLKALYNYRAFKAKQRAW